MSLEDTITKARAKIITNYPFFAHLILNLRTKVVEDGSIPTAATDSRSIIYNREWCDKLTVDELIGVIVHETLHAAHAHTLPWRRGYREPKKWNIAADYVVNDIITKNGLSLPKGCLVDTQYSGMSTEEVYKILDKENKDDSCGGTGFDLQEPKSGDGEGEGGSSDGNGSGEGFAMSESDQKQLAKEWEGKMMEAAQLAKMQGKLPAGMDRIIDDIANPRIPWYEYLSSLAGEILRDDYAFEQPDRRFLQSGVYLPDLYSEGAMVAVAVDTSGSIGQKEMHLFLSEAFGILKSKNVTRIRLMACDAAVQFDKILTSQSSVPENLPGGGGTDFRPVFKRIDNAQEKPEILIYLTDLYGTFPEEPEYPVIWVAHQNGDMEAPWGTQINFNPTDEEMETFTATGHVSTYDVDDCYEEDEEYQPEEY